MAALEPPDTVFDKFDTQDYQKDGQLTVLWAVALWYNGVGIQHGNSVYHIGCTKPPSLKTLIGCSETEWEESYKPAFESLKSDGAFKDQTLLRRKVPWAPTQDCVKFIGEIFGDSLAQICVPGSMFNTKKGHVGDWHELLPHRTAVEHAATWLDQLGYEWELYPGEPGQKRGDARGFGITTGAELPQNLHVEVLSAHHDHAMWARKYNMFAQDDSMNALWVFENREEASKAVNYLSGGPGTNCSIANAPLRNDGQYSIQTINKYIADSKDDPQYTCDGIDHVQTITGIHDSKLDRGIRRPVAIWNTDIDEAEVLTETEQASLSLREINHGASLETLVAGPDTVSV